MSDRLSVTSSELRTTAGNIRASAGNIAGEFSRVMGRVNELSGSWSGQAAGSFHGYYEQFNTSWSQCREALEGVARLLDTAANSYDEAERNIAGQFNKG